MGILLFTQSTLRDYRLSALTSATAFNTTPQPQLAHIKMGRAQGDSEEGPLLGTTSTEWLREKRRRDEEPARGIQWSRAAWSMLPWVITAPLGKTERKLPKVTPTSYLNGLRGVACLIVYNYHIMTVFNMSLKVRLGTVHFVNLAVAGHGATMVFFVLSGFVLSYSPLAKISSPENLDSALLHLPVVLHHPPRLPPLHADGGPRPRPRLRHLLLARLPALPGPPLGPGRPQDQLRPFHCSNPDIPAT
ncbi:hypothetical protein F5883DRAFT_642019 [Diaporthe sp. PMI_573]|nr:hypothetical protein F5883DRAFT_642019 [Diaporthaceae sp. PMI_573]